MVIPPKLIQYASSMSALIGGPVYYVGSAVYTPHLNPRDHDIRLILPDFQFCLRYFPERWNIGCEKLIKEWYDARFSGSMTLEYWRWAEEMVKYSDYGRMSIKLNIDFQVYPESHDDDFYGKFHKWRIRLDTRDSDKPREIDFSI